ncbi:DUF2155 domain-containing protein [Phenylobacterium sp.]|uniref:DUF2155 domain-containing protein n=1 Tax=Phenylobacterium sp. TaxID=1871053 RepID=UPI002DF055C1|nr:DUF2155 domain-containing protein [Phenylobacterium sp.]
MSRRFSRTLALKRGLWLAAVSGLALAGAVAAQPAPPQAPPAPTAAPAPAPAAEEAPPVNVATPQPVVVPSITDKDVAPAPPEHAETAQTKAPDVPQRRPRYDIAVIQALDKVTAETLRFEAAVGRPVRYKTLIFTVRACEHSAPDEPTEDAAAYVEVLSQPRAEPGRPVLPPKQAFKGWMYASSPSLNPLEHPVYDAWLITCRASAPLPGAAPAH